MAFTLSKPVQEIGPQVIDGDLLRFMCRPMTDEEVAERIKRLYDEDFVDPWPGVQRYRCIYWDEATSLCTIYDHRPAMCSDYPYPLNADFHTADPTAGQCVHGCSCQGAPLIGETMD